MSLFRKTPAARDLEALTSGDGKRIGKRVRSHAITSLLRAVGVWKLIGRLYR